MIVIVDSDGFVGSININDNHYKTSNKILLKLNERKSTLIYPATVIVETVTLLQGRLKLPKLADQIIQLVRNNQLMIETVDNEVLQKASLFMDINKSSKHHTLFDAVVVAVAEKYKADAIFSFDRFYKTKGFKLAWELK